MSRKTYLSPESLAILNLLRERGPCNLVELRRHLPAEFSKFHLVKRLGTLVDNGWLQVLWPDENDRQWLISPSARAALPKLQQTDAPVLVPPRSINVMAGNYEHRLMPPARLGALDYQRCASHGVRC